MPEEIPNPRTPDDDSLVQGGNWFSARIESWLARVTPSCTEMTHLLSEELDHPLPWRTRLKMRLHFVMCCYCERYKKNLHYLRRLLRTYPWLGTDVSGDVIPPERKEQMKRELRDEAGRE